MTFRNKSFPSSFLLSSVTWLLAAHLALCLLTSTVFNQWAVGFFKGETGLVFFHLIVQASIIVAGLLSPNLKTLLSERKWTLFAVSGYGCSVLYSTLSQISPFSYDFAIKACLVFLTPMSLGVFLPYILTEKRQEQILNGLVGFFVLMSVLALCFVIFRATRFFGIAIPHNPDQRGGSWATQSIFGHRNAIGSFLSFWPAVLSVSWFHAKDFKIRLYYSIAFVLIVAHLFLTFSRSSQVLALMTLIPFLARLLNLKARWLVGILISLFLISYLIVAAFPMIQAYLPSGWFELETIKMRDIFWIKILNLMPGHWWFGYGLFRISIQGETAHNVYVTQIAYYGVVGLFAFLLMLGSFARDAFKKFSNTAVSFSDSVFITIILGLLLQGMVEYMITFPAFFTNSMFWIFVGIVCAKRRAECRAGKDLGISESPAARKAADQTKNKV